MLKRDLFVVANLVTGWNCAAVVERIRDVLVYCYFWTSAKLCFLSSWHEYNAMFGLHLCQKLLSDDCWWRDLEKRTAERRWALPWGTAVQGWTLLSLMMIAAVVYRTCAQKTARGTEYWIYSILAAFSSITRSN